MTNDNLLSKMTVAAFCKEAVKNVVLIDEQFPNLHEALSTIHQTEGDKLAAKYKECGVAQGLYQELHDQHLLCDVANAPEDWEGGLSSRISESDLVILDLHLQGDSDSTDSIDLLRSLAASRKFNLVIVYTGDTGLSTVAYRIAGSLRGMPVDEITEDFEAEFPDVVERLDEYGCPDVEVIDAFLLDRNPKDNIYRPFLGKVMENHQSMRENKEALLAKLAIKLLKDNHGAIPKDKRWSLSGANFTAENPWMVFENAFIVVANKKKTLPSKVIPALEKAIVEWNPGIVRTLVAQIQNTMSHRGYAFGDPLSNDLPTQIGWLWHATSPGGCENTKDAVRILLNRMLLGLRKNLFSDKKLSAFTKECLSKIPIRDGVDQQIEEVKGWCGQSESEDVDPNSVLHALNAYQSSAPFEGEHITTGTIMFSDDDSGQRWWVCVEPACNMVPNQAPASSKFIQCQLLELFKKTDDADAIVSDASKSKYLFVVFGEQREYLSVVNEFDQPILRVAYARKKRPTESSNHYDETIIFFPSLKDAKPKLTCRRMQIVAQLHEPYANRLLHLTGHHLSRIGLDFVDRPQESSAKTIEAK